MGSAMQPDQPAKSLDGRRGPRFVSQDGFPARVMAIDGTWCRDCKIMDVSDLGAKLRVDQSLEGLHLQEFFLVLSRTGIAHRRCELVWFRGGALGVNFVRRTSATGQPESAMPGASAEETFPGPRRRHVERKLSSGAES
jgi:hypothetical protein